MLCKVLQHSKHSNESIEIAIFLNDRYCDVRGDDVSSSVEVRCYLLTD